MNWIFAGLLMFIFSNILYLSTIFSSILFKDEISLRKMIGVIGVIVGLIIIFL